MKRELEEEPEILQRDIKGDLAARRLRLKARKQTGAFTKTSGPNKGWRVTAREEQSGRLKRLGVDVPWFFSVQVCSLICVCIYNKLTLVVVPTSVSCTCLLHFYDLQLIVSLLVSHSFIVCFISLFSGIFQKVCLLLLLCSDFVVLVQTSDLVLCSTLFSFI